MYSYIDTTAIPKSTPKDGVHLLNFRLEEKIVVAGVVGMDLCTILIRHKIGVNYHESKYYAYRHAFGNGK